MNYKYKAFISYNHINKRAAIRLHKDLEKIKFAKGQLANGAKSLYPIFIDRDEMLPGEELDDELKKNLSDSQYLIVVCTKDSSESNSVDDEITYFRSLPQGHNIIPVILDNHNNVSHEAFPQALEYRTEGKYSLALNLGGEKPFRKRIDRHTLMKVAAPIAALPLTELWSREKKRERRNMVVTGLFAVVLISAPMIYWDLKLRTFEDDYKNFYRSPTGWVGIDQAQSKISTSYRFKKQGRLGKTDSVLRINKGSICDRNEPTTEIDLFSIRIAYLHESNYIAKRFCSADLTYHLNGTINTEKIYTSLGPNGSDRKLIEEFRYPTDVCTPDEIASTNASNCAGDFRDNFNNLKIKVAFSKRKLSIVTAIDVSKFGLANDSVLESKRMRLSYDNKTDRLETLEYFDFNNNSEGKTELDYFENGELREIFMTEFTENSATSFTFDRLSFAYDRFGRLETRKIFRGNRLLSQLPSFILTAPEKHQDHPNAFYVSYTYPQSNQVHKRFFNSQHKPVEVVGVHSIQKNQNGTDFEWAYFDLEGSPAVDDFGVHKSKSKIKREHLGSELTRSFFDLTGEAVTGPFNYHKQTSFIQKKYSSQGLGATRLSPGLFMNIKQFNEEGLLLENSEGVAYLDGVTNKEGQVTELSLLNAHGELVNNDLGIAHVEWNSNSNQQTCSSSDGIKMKLFGQRENSLIDWEELPCASESLAGYSTIMSRKSSAKNPTQILEEIYAKGISVKNRYITGRKIFEHRANGIVIEKITDHLQSRQHNLPGVEVWHTWNNGTMIESALHEKITGSRSSNHQGYSFSRFAYEKSELGSLETVSYFNKNQAPLKHLDVGAHSVTTSRDNNNTVLKQTFYDKNGAIRTERFTSLVYEYQDSGETMIVSAYDIDNKAIESEMRGSQISSVTYTNKNQYGFYMRKYFNTIDEKKAELQDGTYYIELSNNHSQGNLLWTSRTKLDVPLDSGTATLGIVLAW